MIVEDTVVVGGDGGGKGGGGESGGAGGGDGGDDGILGRFRSPAIPAPPMRKRLGVPEGTPLM